jgi:hypothetical protein
MITRPLTNASRLCRRPPGRDLRHSASSARPSHRNLPMLSLFARAPRAPRAACRASSYFATRPPPLRRRHCQRRVREAAVYLPRPASSAAEGRRARSHDCLAARGDRHGWQRSGTALCHRSHRACAAGTCGTQKRVNAWRCGLSQLRAHTRQTGGVAAHRCTGDGHILGRVAPTRRVVLVVVSRDPSDAPLARSHRLLAHREAQPIADELRQRPPKVRVRYRSQAAAPVRAGAAAPDDAVHQQQEAHPEEKGPAPAALHIARETPRRSRPWGWRRCELGRVVQRLEHCGGRQAVAGGSGSGGRHHSSALRWLDQPQFACLLCEARSHPRATASWLQP